MCVHMPACVATARFTLTRERDFAYMLHVVFARVQHALGCMCVHMSACIRRNMLHCVCVCVCAPVHADHRRVLPEQQRNAVSDRRRRVWDRYLRLRIWYPPCVWCVSVCVHVCVRERERACMCVCHAAGCFITHTHTHKDTGEARARKVLKYQAACAWI